MLRSGDLLNLAGVIFKVLDGSHVEAAYHEEIYRTAVVDGLTQIPNRRHLDEVLAHELHRAHRYDRPLVLMLFDVDHFKSINDRFGHVAGDQVLRELALVVRSRLRSEACFGRYGGEEFAVVLPETTLDEARIVAERVRGQVEAHAFRLGDELLPVTVSVGLCERLPQHTDIQQLYECVDACLYEAKDAGRNRVAAVGPASD